MTAYVVIRTDKWDAWPEEFFPYESDAEKYIKAQPDEMQKNLAVREVRIVFI